MDVFFRCLYGKTLEQAFRREAHLPLDINTQRWSLEEADELLSKEPPDLVEARRALQEG